MIVPAFLRKSPARSTMCRKTSLRRGRRYGGSSMIIRGGLPLSSVRLKSHAKPKAPSVPSAYIRTMMPTFAASDTLDPGSRAAIIIRYTGRRAEQLISGATFQAADARSERRPGDVGDPAASALYQVAGGEAADSFIIGADVGCVGLGEAPVDQDVGHAARFDAFEEREGSRRLGRGDQQAIHLARQQAVHFAGFDRAIFLGVADHHIVAQRADGGGYALGDFGEEGVHQVESSE